MSDTFFAGTPIHPDGRGPHELIEDQVERTPDSPALTLGAEQISYRELNARSNRLANFLREAGVTPESLVGVCLDRSLESVVSLLAILKAGGTYLPLDPKFPEERLAFMLEDSGVPLLLTHSSRQDSLPPTTSRVVLLDREHAALGRYPATDLGLPNNPDHLAYLIYTSGSTGKPKGVMIPRRALANFLLSMSDKPGMAASDIHLAVTTTSFDISILEFLLPLVRGAQIVIATGVQSADAQELQRLLVQHAITVMQATPTTWRMLVENGWEGKNDLRIFCGGEALTADLASKLLPRCRELWNMYGPTETTIWSSTERITSADHIALGSPIANTQFHVLDENRNRVSLGTPGELWIGGTGLARGYLKRPELTADKFVVDFTAEVPDARLYRTGDEVRYRSDGSLEFLGRLDQQVKLHGFRIELGEVETALSSIEGIRQAVVVLREDRPGDKRLAGYYTGVAGLSSTSIVQHLKTTLPDYMIPSVFVRMEHFPLTPNAKLDRKSLPLPEGKRPLLAQEFIAPRTAAEKQLASLWCELLQLQEVGIDDSFFDLGGNSLAAVRMVNVFRTRFAREIPPLKVFQYPTIGKLGRFLEEGETKSDFLAEADHRARHQRDTHPENEKTAGVAVIGMTGRFPGAANLDQLWHNLCGSVESISFFTPEELGPGIDEHLRRDPDYVRARGLIEGADLFDAAFFGVNPLEARVMDPQQRVFLELAQQALENAGCDPERYKGRIGVFAGIGDNHYYTTNLLTQPDLLAMAGKLAVEYGNQKDYIALRTAYLLDLRGPAISLNTACSTTLLAVDQACRSLFDYECDVALSGGVDITVPQKSGFLYQEGGTFAKDGHCRPFDAEATGTMFCDGAGVVVLKRLTDALADGDTIYAVIRGSGKNNNGARPASFLAPSAEGQAEAIALAQSNANVPVETIRYIEAHGTGTPVGDPIEFEALRKVFESKTEKKQFCYLGSIKGNIGHPTNAAGVAGLIKAALVLYYEQIPATLHFKTPNPKIDFATSPFIMADRLIPFPRGSEVRRTAVSSFGFGGTNVHIILEEAPAPKDPAPSRPLQLFPLSAKTPAALDAYSLALAKHLGEAAPEAFADAAYTFQAGRKQMAYRRFVVAADSSEATRLLLQPAPLRCSSKHCVRRDPPVVFLFGGQGTQYVNMGLNLYRDEPLFRAVVDDCCEHLKPHLGRDLRELLYPRTGDQETAQISLRDTFFTQPSIFVIEYALARFWQSLSIEPAVMAGHSIGEFVAATLANVWDLEDALAIIALRGRLMQNLPRGVMMALSASAESISKILPPGLQIASNNAPGLCVVSGPEPDATEFQKQLEEQNIVFRRLHTSHAFHSAMMDPMVEPLREAVSKIRLRPPAMPIISTVTGRPLTAAETTNPAYWARHSRATVDFSKAIRHIKDQGYDLFLECGPRSTLCSLTRQHFKADQSCTAIPTFADTDENNLEWATLLFALGSLWQNGVSIDWDAFHANEVRRRIPLPTYPFERRRFWVDPAQVAPSSQSVRDNSSAPIENPSIKPLAAASTSREKLDSQKSFSSRAERIASQLIDLLIPVCGRERSQISTSATFMEQGFDSLSLTQVTLAIRKEFSVKVSFSQLMKDWPNIDLLAGHIDSTLPAEIADELTARQLQVSTATPLAVTPVADPTPKSTLEETVREQARSIARLVGLLEKAGVNHGNPATGRDTTSVEPDLIELDTTVPQRGIFASSRLSPSLSASYNESVTLRFSGTIAIEKMSRAIQRLVERHDALRASFDEKGLVMKIARAQKVTLPVSDLSSIQDPVQREDRLHKLITDETSMPFPLPEGPLFRSQIVLLGPDHAAVILTAHHIICDGWSLDVLIHDLCAFYSEELSGVSAAPEQGMSYAEYVRSVTQRHDSNEFKDASRYWHAKFEDGLPVLVLPADHPRSARREFKARRIDQPIPKGIAQNLRMVAAKRNCSLFSLLLSSLAILLARISQQRRFVIALPSAEQPIIGETNLAGHCVNLLPFLVTLRDNEAAGDFVDRVQNELLVAQEHASFTMASLLEDLRATEAARGLSPIVTGLTSVKKFKPSELPQHGFTVEYDINPKTYESFELYFNAVEIEEDIELRCNYDTKLFDNLTVRTWIEMTISIFQDISSDLSRAVSDLAWLKPSGAAGPIEIVFTPKLKSSPKPNPVHSPSLKDFQSLGLDPPQHSPVGTTETLRALIPLWQRVLGIPDVGPDDDFFVLGGHSITAAKLFILIERELRRAAPLAALYEAPTPRMLANVLCKDSEPEDQASPGAFHESSDRRSRSHNGAEEPRRASSDGPGPNGKSGTVGLAVHQPLNLAYTVPLTQRHNGKVQITSAQKNYSVRPFVERDLSQVADLWWTHLRRRKGPAPPSVQSYFSELYFGPNPWIDGRLPSLVYEGKNGRILGFLGVSRRTMSVYGQSIRAAFGGNYVVHPDARSTPAGLALLEAYLAGDQDLSMTDSANDESQVLMERLGFRTLVPLSVSWAHPLRPSHYAVHALSAAIGPVFSTSLKFAAKPFCSLIDSVVTRVPGNRLHPSKSTLHAAELDVEMLLKCLAEFHHESSFTPQYDAASLRWHFAFMEKMHPRATLRKIILRNDQQKIIGWYIYYVKAGTVAQVVQIGGPRQFTPDVLDHLFYDAWQLGAIALHGVVASDLMPEFWKKNCFFTCRSGWALAHSRNPELLEPLNRGDAFFSRLDGEWSLGFEE